MPSFGSSSKPSIERRAQHDRHGADASQTVRHPARVEPLIGTTLENTYRVTHLLQRGPMHSAYHALHLRLNRVVSVVLLEPTLQGLDYAKYHFEKAADLAATVIHPNIAQILDVGVSPAGPYFVMEALQGSSLGDLLNRAGPLTANQTTSLTLQLASALDFLHHQDLEVPKVDPSMVHVAIKDDNVTAKLVNLPIAASNTKRHSDAPMSIAATRRSRGRLQPAPRDDQFFLAMTTCSALAGEFLVAHDWGDRPAPRAAHLLPLQTFNDWPRTCAILDRALGSSTEGRFETSMQFAIRLLEASKRDSLDAGAGLDLRASPSKRSSAQSTSAATLMDLSQCLEQDALMMSLRLAQDHDESSASSPDEAFLISRLGDGCTLSALLDASTMPKELALRTVSTLLLRGVLEAVLDGSTGDGLAS